MKVALKNKSRRQGMYQSIRTSHWSQEDLRWYRFSEENPRTIVGTPKEPYCTQPYALIDQ